MNTELESILGEQALPIDRELKSFTDAAPDGQVLAAGDGPDRDGRDPEGDTFRSRPAA